MMAWNDLVVREGSIYHTIRIFNSIDEQLEAYIVLECVVQILDDL